MVHRLLAKAGHFGRVRQLISNVDRGMLARGLQGVRSSKVIGQRMFPRIPPHIRCSLASLNSSLEPVVGDVDS